MSLLRSRRSRTLAGLAVGAGVIGAVAPAAVAQSADTVPLAGGDTRLHLNTATAGVLADNGVAVAPIGPATARGTRVTFPITGGRINPTNGAGTVLHSGGLSFSAGGTTVRLRNFSVDTRTGALTAQVGGSRVRIIDLDTADAAVIRRGTGRAETWIVRVQAELSATGAAALNAAFDTDLFARGIPLGRVDVLTEPGQYLLRGGDTSLSLAPATAAALQGLGVTVGNVPPAAANTAGALEFPVTGQRIRANNFVGRITPFRRHLPDRGHDDRRADQLRHQRRRDPGSDRACRRQPHRDPGARPRELEDRCVEPSGRRDERQGVAHRGRGRRTQPGVRRDRVRRGPRARDRPGPGPDQVATAPPRTPWAPRAGAHGVPGRGPYTPDVVGLGAWG